MPATGRPLGQRALPQIASLEVIVGPGVSISPAKASVEAGGSVDFVPAGDSGTGYQ